MAELSLPADVVKARMRDALKSCPCCGASILGFYEWPQDLDEERFVEVSFQCSARVVVPHDGDQYQVAAGCPQPLAERLESTWEEILGEVEFAGGENGS